MEENNIVDKIIDKSGTATWYQFRIPIRNPDRVYGSISDFKTIEIYKDLPNRLGGEPTVLRFAKLQMVGSQWNKYEESLFQSGLNEVSQRK